MAKVTSPLLSLAAGGAVGKTQVYAHWRGIPYVRKYVVPANPKSTGQTATRTVFSFAVGMWKVASTAFIAPWNAYATGQPLTGRNAFIGKNVKILREAANIDDIIFSPGALGGLPCTAITATGTSTAIAVTATVPTPPQGWTLTGLTAVAALAQDPATGTTYVTNTGTAASPFNSLTLTAVSAGTYEVGAWPVWSNASGKTAYGPDIKQTATVT